MTKDRRRSKPRRSCRANPMIRASPWSAPPRRRFRVALGSSENVVPPARKAALKRRTPRRYLFLDINLSFQILDRLPGNQDPIALVFTKQLGASLRYLTRMNTLLVKPLRPERC